jgi:hypothetical protein
MTSMFNPTVGSSATSANSRHSRLPLQADLAVARGIVTTWRTTPSKPPSRSSRPGFASAVRGKADGQLPSIPIAAEGSRRVGPLRGFLPRGLSNACPHASSCAHAAADKGRRRTTLNELGQSSATKDFVKLVKGCEALKAVINQECGFCELVRLNSFGRTDRLRTNACIQQSSHSRIVVEERSALVTTEMTEPVGKT